VLGVHRDGALTEYVSVPAAFVVKTNGLSFDDAAMIEFCPSARTPLARAQVSTAERVFGGRCRTYWPRRTAFCKLRGAEVAVVDSRQDRLEFSRLGACPPIHIVPLSKDTRDELGSLTGGESSTWYSMRPAIHRPMEPDSATLPTVVDMR